MHAERDCGEWHVHWCTPTDMLTSTIIKLPMSESLECYAASMTRVTTCSAHSMS